MKINIEPYTLEFKRPAGTSRGVLHTKNCWFIKIVDAQTGSFGVGEINMFKGLSYDDKPDFFDQLNELTGRSVDDLKDFHENFKEFPSIRFGLEMALMDFQNGGKKILFQNDFVKGETGIPINGLIWMGDMDFMKLQIKEKLRQGFTCLKMKIGALNFEQELSVLKIIRKSYSAKDLELRVDANGAFNGLDALSKLDQLSQLQLHSIEQPIKQGQIEHMANLCKKTPLPIALDEELIGVLEKKQQQELLSYINPQYIILKPSLLGGFAASEDWIKLAENNHIAWWVTSALESNVGLNAIAQWTASLKTAAYQGLGTGQLYDNNISSPLEIRGEKLFYNPDLSWATF